MLQQLEFKLQVELQYKRAIEQMAKLYKADGDKRSRADTEIKRIESDKKIHLLQTALKKYKTLHILDEDVEEEGESRFGTFFSIIVLRLPVLQRSPPSISEANARTTFAKRCRANSKSPSRKRASSITPR